MFFGVMPAFKASIFVLALKRKGADGSAMERFSLLEIQGFILY